MKLVFVVLNLWKNYIFYANIFLS